MQSTASSACTHLLLVGLLVGCNGRDRGGTPLDSGSPDSGGSDGGSPDSGGSDGGTVGDGGAPVTPDIVVDLDRRGQILVGLGAQVWPGDSAWPVALDPMAASLARMPIDPGFDSLPAPLPTADDDIDTWVDAHWDDGWPGLTEQQLQTATALHDRGVDIVAHYWGAPTEWEVRDTLPAAHVDDLAALWVAGLYRLESMGLGARWFDPLNEPDGDWATYVPPDLYSELLVALRARMDERGLDHIGLIGPGTSTLDGWATSTDYDWFTPMSDDAVAAVGAWSVHAWDDVDEAGEGRAFLEEQWEGFDALVDAHDPGGAKPIIVTELGSKDADLAGVTYGAAEDCGHLTESDAYGLRLLEHAIVALNHGAGGLITWQAADQDWSCENWGLVTSAPEGATPRRPLDALVSQWAGLSPGAQVVERTWTDDLNLAALVQDEGVVLLATNTTDADIDRTIGVTGLGSAELTDARRFAVDDHLLRDELRSTEQLADTTGSLTIDDSNSSQFDGDADRLTRADKGDASLAWRVDGTIDSATVVVWRWPDVDDPGVQWAWSSDGETWTSLSSTVTSSRSGWIADTHALEPPAGATWLRLTLPETGGPTWTPQVGDAWIAWTTATSTPAPALVQAEPPVVALSLPAWSATTVVLTGE